MHDQPTGEFLVAFGQRLIDGTMKPEDLIAMTLATKGKPSELKFWEIVRIKGSKFTEMIPKAFLRDHTPVMVGRFYPSNPSKPTRRHRGLVVGVKPSGEVNCILEASKISHVATWEGGRYFSCYAPEGNCHFHYLWRWENDSATLIWKIDGGEPVHIMRGKTPPKGTRPVFYRSLGNRGYADESTWIFLNTIYTEAGFRASSCKRGFMAEGCSLNEASSDDRHEYAPDKDGYDTSHLGAFMGKPIILHGYKDKENQLTWGDAAYHVGKKEVLSLERVCTEDDTPTFRSTSQATDNWSRVELQPEGFVKIRLPGGRCENPFNPQEILLRSGFGILVPRDSVLQRSARGDITLTLPGHSRHPRPEIKFDILMWDGNPDQGRFYAARHLGNGSVVLMQFKPLKTTNAIFEDSFKQLIRLSLKKVNVEAPFGEPYFFSSQS
jgi:hypothetical protein